jgi:hypothetical protein
VVVVELLLELEELELLLDELLLELEELELLELLLDELLDDPESPLVPKTVPSSLQAPISSSRTAAINGSRTGMRIAKTSAGLPWEGSYPPEVIAVGSLPRTAESP